MMPPGVVTTILPVVDIVPKPTVALIVVEFATVKANAAVPLIVTELAPLKFDPVIVIGVPVYPLCGLKLLIVGGACVALTKYPTPTGFEFIIEYDPEGVPPTKVYVPPEVAHEPITLRLPLSVLPVRLNEPLV